MTQKNPIVQVRCADGEMRELSLVRIVGETAYVCKPSLYETAMKHPEVNVEVGFPLKDIRMKEAAH